MTDNNNSIVIKAFAKVNLVLDVVSKREDGYHNIVSVMQNVSLFDTLHIETTPGEIGLEASGLSVPGGADNLVLKAAETLKKRLDTPLGANISLTKNIPVAAGLGGGSSDAAAVLTGLNLLWKANLGAGELREIAVSLGADVPFFLEGGTVLAEGIGDKLCKLKALPRIWLVLFKPPFEVLTADVYGAYDNMEVPVHRRPDVDGFLRSLQTEDYESAVKKMGNSLEAVAAALFPQIGHLAGRLGSLSGGKVMMCGSGPTLLAVVDGRSAGENLHLLTTGLPGKAYLVHTVGKGMEIVSTGG